MKGHTPALLLAVLGAVPAAAQTVEDVVMRYVATRGGFERIRSVMALRLVGSLSAGSGVSGPFRLELKRPGKMRVEISIQGSTITQATDASQAWVISPMVGGGRAVIVPPEEARALQDQADLEGPLVDYRSKGHRVQLTGRDSRFGSEAFRLRVQLKSGDIRYAYIDAESYRQVAEEGERPSPRGLVRVETRLSDHRVVDGLLVPFVLDISAADGAEKQKITFDTVEVNPALDDARFAVPPGAKAPPSPTK
jgi:hypothetical protein